MKAKQIMVNRLRYRSPKLRSVVYILDLAFPPPFFFNSLSFPPLCSKKQQQTNYPLSVNTLSQLESFGVCIWSLYWEGERVRCQAINISSSTTSLCSPRTAPLQHIFKTLVTHSQITPVPQLSIFTILIPSIMISSFLSFFITPFSFTELIN